MLKRAHNTAAGAANSLSNGVIAVLAAAFIIATFAGIAIAMEKMQGNADILYGRVAAVDSSHPTKSLTLDLQKAGKPAMSIFVTGQTEVKMCGEDKSLKDVKVGSNAQVTYHELAGLTVADSIKTPCS